MAKVVRRRWLLVRDDHDLIFVTFRKNFVKNNNHVLEFGYWGDWQGM